MLVFSVSAIRDLEYWCEIATLKEISGDWSGQDILPAYQSLYDSNNDMMGWLKIDISWQNK